MINFSSYNLLQQEKDSFLEIIKKIKEGDTLLRNKFIDDFKPFILKCVSQLVGKKNNLTQSDEYSIALIAFNEAIESYDLNKKTKFVSFSKQVIKRRLIDYLRSTNKNVVTVPFSYLNNYNTGFSEHSNNTFEEKFLYDKNSDYSIEVETKEEIKNLELKIYEYKMTIEDLIECSPKHRDTIVLCLNVAKIIIENESLYQSFRERKILPYKELAERFNLSRRTLEKNRKFIIAMVFILKSDLEILKKYIYDTMGR
ncbi:MAG TPA: RNA polymerase sigma-I factor [Acetivibrio sp.]|uniref:RNA polymerase sigma-I factor n=1 Tax=Acetivibrio sp. TaxID=1872092 RepID=UPI002C4E38FC|nr:RNA polymerase sigma-I factor [Acetivibrio sp.]HOM02341.1 RNA polymerase sigma-I factor [Acetivibrio sp.]